MSAYCSRVIGDSEALYRARIVLYSKPNACSPDELAGAITALRHMVENNDPAAMHQLGQVLWEGLVVAKDDQEALELFEKAVALNHAPALISLGAYHQANAQTDSDYERATAFYEAYFDWQEQENSRLGRDAIFYARNLVPIGSSGLNEREFFRSFGISMNGVSYLAPTPVLRKINDWRLDAKQGVSSFQKIKYEQDPTNSHFNPRLPPLAPINGFRPTAALGGDHYITHLGLELAWTIQPQHRRRLWIPLTEFGFPENDLPSLNSMEEFDCCLGNISKSTADKIRASIDAPPSMSMTERVKNLWQGLFAHHPREKPEYKLLITFFFAPEGASCIAYVDGRKVFDEWDEFL